MATNFCLFPPLMILTIFPFSSSGNAQVSEVTSSNGAVLYASPPPPNGCPYSCLPPPTPTDCPPPPSSPQQPIPSSPPPSGSVNYPSPSGYYLPPGGYFLPPPVYVYVGPPPPNPILPYLPFYYKNPPPPSDYSSAASHYVTIKRMKSKLLVLFTLLIWCQ